jgi:hypothetical protein
MASPTRPNAPLASTPFVPSLKTPEKLVGVGFRCWMSGYRTGDVSSWEYAWNLYASELGPNAAKTAVAELGSWVRTINDCSGRSISTLPTDCPGFCRDECVAISMIAASQHKVCPALKACAFALIGCSQVETIMAETDRFALTLAALDQRLSTNSICMAANLVPPSSSAQH